MPNFKRRKLMSNKQRIIKYKKNQKESKNNDANANSALASPGNAHTIIAKSPSELITQHIAVIKEYSSQILNQEKFDLNGNILTKASTTTTIDQADAIAIDQADEKISNSTVHAVGEDNTKPIVGQIKSKFTNNVNQVKAAHAIVTNHSRHYYPSNRHMITTAPIQSYYPPVMRITEQPRLHNKQQFRFVIITLLASLLTGNMLMSHSIQLYYQLTYHHNLSKIPIVENNAKPLMDHYIGLAQKQIDQINQDTINYFNREYVYTAAYKKRLKILQQQHQAKQAALQVQAHELSKQARTKAAFTLAEDDQVFFAGDSLMQGVAPFVQKWLNEEHHIKSINLSKQSTGLTYPGFFNWPQTITETLAENQQIKMLVVYLGPNDPWDMPNPVNGKFLHFQSQPWETVYRNRIKNIMQQAHQHQVTVLWLLPPDVRRNKLNQQMVYLRKIIQDEVERNQGYIMDTRTLLSSSQNGQFNDSITDSNGRKIKTRSADGIHFSIEGQKILAKAILAHFHFNPNS